MRVPDAWDECGGCGHDRDDHLAYGGCRGYIVTNLGYNGNLLACNCNAFEEPAA